MKIKASLAILLSFFLLCGATSFVNAQNNPEQKPKTDVQKDNDDEDDEVSTEERSRVKISIEQARKTALERVNGTITEEELEKENGRIVYSIEIRDANRKVYDVEVDAQTGAIVRIEEETDDDEEDDDDRKSKETKPPLIR